MKTAERHRLKSNELAATIGDLQQHWETHRGRVVGGAVAVVILAGALGGYWYWRHQRASGAQALMADAMSVATAPVGPPPAPGTPGPAVTYPTEQARAEAALARFQQVVASYGSTAEGQAARYHAAALLASLGRTADAEREFKAVADSAAGSVYGRMARLGMAELQVQARQFDPAITTYREIAASPDGDVPADGVLMRLARAYQLAGRTSEALQTYTRVVEQFPESLYAADARREIQRLKAPGKAS